MLSRFRHLLELLSLLLTSHVDKLLEGRVVRQFLFGCRRCAATSDSAVCGLFQITFSQATTRVLGRSVENFASRADCNNLGHVV